MLQMTLKTSEGERVTCKLCLRMQFTERRDMTPEMFESVNLKSFDSKNVHPIMAKSAKQLGKHLVQVRLEDHRREWVVALYDDRHGE